VPVNSQAACCPARNLLIPYLFCRHTPRRNRENRNHFPFSKAEIAKAESRNQFPLSSFLFSAFFPPFTQKPFNFRFPNFRFPPFLLPLAQKPSSDP
jgi:hypothetical protein